MTVAELIDFLELLPPHIEVAIYDEDRDLVPVKRATNVRMKRGGGFHLYYVLADDELAEQGVVLT